MKVSFEYDARGWQLTPRVAELFNKVKKKEDFLHAAFISLQSKLNILVYEEVIYDPLVANITAEGNYKMAGEDVCIVAVTMITDKYLNKKMIVHVELHIMMQDEYKEVENVSS